MTQFPQQSTLSFGFAGDFCLTRFSKKSDEEFDQLMNTVCQLNSQVDVSMANFEFYIEKDSQQSSSMGFPDHCSAKIGNSGFDIFNLANNHILDGGEENLIHTIDRLHSLDVKTVGAGSHLAQATTPLIIECKGKKIGILNVTDATHYQALTQKAGVAPLLKKQLIAQVKELVQGVDLVIVSIHADLEFSNYPAPWKVKLSRQLVDAGANMVIHHHSHTLQGIEEYHDGLIAYSLGNFIFPTFQNSYMQDRPGRINEAIYLVINAKLDEKKISLSYQAIPTQINPDLSLQIATQQEKQHILDRLQTYSESVSNHSLLVQKHRQRCVEELKEMLENTYCDARKNGLKTVPKHIKHHLSTQQHIQWIRGVFSFGYF